MTKPIKHQVSQREYQLPPYTVIRKTTGDQVRRAVTRQVYTQVYPTLFDIRERLSNR